MRRVYSMALLLLAFTSTSSAEDFPAELVKWKPVAENPVFKGTGEATWDRKIRERGWILFEEGTFHLWYTGYNDDLAATKFLGHATSADGVKWTRDPANPIFSKGWVEDVCVVKRDGVYTMFAEGKNDIAHSLTSTDRVHWEEQGPLDIRRTDGKPISEGSYGTPTIWVEGGTWYLFYERGDQGVWLATSKDRKVWKNASDKPVLRMGPEPYDRHAVAMNQIVKRDGVYYAYYHANANKPWKEWTTCIARSKDLIHWEKYGGNPIVEQNASSGVLVEGPKGPRLYTMHPEIRLYENAVEGKGVGK